MIGRWTSQVRKLVRIHTDSRHMALLRLMLGVALCALIGGMAPAAAAWHETASTPPQRLYARAADGIWVSDDARISWSQAGALPSRPLAMAVAQRTPGLVFVGTESDGLLRSSDGGASWQPADNTALAGAHTALLAVTALAIDPEDDQIIYAATDMWLGTYTARLTPLGVAVSVDGGQQWLQISRAQLRDTRVWRLDPVAGEPLSVVTTNGAGSSTMSLGLSPELLALLRDSNPAIRASAARAIGLIGDPAALPALQQALADPDALAGQRIAEAIGRIGDRSVSADLLKVLGSATAAERARAALALGLLKSAEAVPGLAVLLSAGGPDAQRMAAEALATIGTPEALVALTAPLADQQMTPARHAAMGGLEMAGPSAVAAVVAALNDASAVVRANAAEMLGWLKSGDAVADLAPLLTDPDAAVRTQAAWALGEIDTAPARLALNPAPILASLAPPSASAPLITLPAAIADVPADAWNLAARAAMLMLVLIAMLAVAWTWQGPQRPKTHFRPA